MAVRELLDWSAYLRQTLERYDEPLLRQVTGQLVRPRSQWPVEDLIERSLATVANAAVVDRRLETLEPAGRRLLEKDIGSSLLEATGLGEEFAEVQRTVARLRDNLLRATQTKAENP